MRKIFIYLQGTTTNASLFYVTVIVTPKTDKRTSKTGEVFVASYLNREVGIKPACKTLNLNHASFYRTQQPPSTNIIEHPRPPLTLSSDEEQQVLTHLHSERFMDNSPYQVYAALLDEDIYLCSISTFYRILARHQKIRERHNQLRRPNTSTSSVHRYSKPKLLTTTPNQI